MDNNARDATFSKINLYKRVFLAIDGGLLYLY